VADCGIARTENKQYRNADLNVKLKSHSTMRSNVFRVLSIGWRQVLDLAALRDDKLFYFYDDLKYLNSEPHGYKTAYEDDIAVTEEIYCRLTFYKCRIRSACLSFTSSVLRLPVHFLTSLCAV